MTAIVVGAAWCVASVIFTVCWALVRGHSGLVCGRCGTRNAASPCHVCGLDLPTAADLPSGRGAKHWPEVDA